MDLDFSDLLKQIESKFSSKGWTRLLTITDDRTTGNSLGIYCGLTTDENLEKELKDNSWGLHYESGKPGLIFSYDNGEDKWRYDRHSESHVEPLLIYRYHPVTNERIITPSEEFVLYFDLFEKREKGELVYVWIDDNAEEYEVLVISRTEVKVKTKFLKVYLNVRKVNLCIFFDSQKFSEKKMSELGLEPKNEIVKTDDLIYSDGCRNIADLGIRNDQTQAWMMGKVVIRREPDFKPDTFNHFADEKYEDFIIGYDDDGEEVEFSCNKSGLSDYFNQIDGAPFFLTPVFFSRDVLKKYYDNPNKYTVSDGSVCLDGFWRLHVDNNIGEYVSVFLGDLSSIPFKEQKYWKSFNIAPQKGVSGTNIKRAIHGQFADPVAVDNFFKQKLSTFNKEWFEKFGWQLFKPLTDSDSHYLTSLHVPSPDNVKEFEEQVLALTKILIDSINDREISKLAGVIPPDAKRLEKFRAFVEFNTKMKFEEMIEFLRMLQRLRSTNVAHRKSSKEDKKVIEYFGLDTKNYYDVFSEILTKSIWIFNTLESHLLERN